MIFEKDISFSDLVSAASNKNAEIKNRKITSTYKPSFFLNFSETCEYLKMYLHEPIHIYTRICARVFLLDQFLLHF